MIVVLDACVLYPPSLRDLLLTLAALDAFDIRWSEEILMASSPGWRATETGDQRRSRDARKHSEGRCVGNSATEPAFLVWGARVKALIAPSAGPEWVVRVERPEWSEDERP